MSAQGCLPGYAGDPYPWPYYGQPYWQWPPPNYWHVPPTYTAPSTAPFQEQMQRLLNGPSDLTEERVREIIREELSRAKEPQ